MGTLLNADICSILRTHPDGMTWHDTLAAGLPGATVVKYRVYEGDMRNVRDDLTGVSAPQYIRDKVVRTAEARFARLLTDDEVRAHLMKELSEDKSRRTVIPQQRIGDKLAESTAVAPTPVDVRAL